MKARLDKKAQTFIAYAVIIGIVTAALLAMQIFMARTFKQKFRQSVDTFGEGEQYERGVTRVTEY
jgi:hypothetical protein